MLEVAPIAEKRFTLKENSKQTSPINYFALYNKKHNTTQNTNTVKFNAIQTSPHKSYLHTIKACPSNEVRIRKNSILSKY